jgi:WD40 repeat protein
MDSVGRRRRNRALKPIDVVMETTKVRPGLRGVVIVIAACLAASPAARAQDVASTTPELVVQTGHQNQIAVAAFSPDSRLVATGDIRGPIRIWEAATGKQLRAIFGHNGSLDALQFSPDGRFLVSAGGPFATGVAVTVWDVATGRAVRSFSAGPNERVTDLAISADGTLVAAAADTVRIWDVASGDQVAEVAVGGSRVTLAFSPRTTLLAVREAARLSFWTPTEPASSPIRLRNQFGARRIVFLADGATLAVPDGDVVQLVNVAKRSIAGRLDAGNDAVLHRLADSSTQLVVGTAKGYQVWDVGTRRKVRDIGRPQVRTAELPSPSWRWMAVPNEPALGAVKVEDLQEGREALVLAGRVAPAGAVAFSPDGSLLATKTGGRFWVWDLKTGEPRMFDGHKSPGAGHLEIDALAFTNEGRALVSADLLWNMIEWDVASRQVSNSIDLKFDKSTITHACSADGRWCVSGQPGRIDVREVETWLVFRTFEVGALRGLAISDDGSYVAAAGPQLEIWDRRNGRRRALAGHADLVSRVAFSPGGRLLASADFSGAVKVWDVATGKEVRAFAAGQTTVTSLAFSPDGRTLATGGADETVRLWNAESGERGHVLEGHADWIAKLAFAPSGRFLASGSADGTIRLWNADSGTEVALLTATKDSEDWLVVTPDGFFDGSALATESLVAWRIGNSAYPPERYYANFFRPGLLATLWRGDAADAGVTRAGIAVPPVIRLLDNGGRVLKEPRLSLRARVEGVAAEVSLYHNGARVGNQPGAPGTTAEYSFGVELIPGENELRAVAVSPDGVSSNPDVIRVSYETPAPARPDLYVLSIGVSRYQTAAWNLGFARDDAEALAAFFRERSARLFDAVSATVLADDMATRSNIQNAIAAIAGRAQPEDVVLIYFAGHGIAVEKTYYLLPHEMRDETSLDADVKKFGLSDRALLDSLRRVRALKKIVILDACESATALDILTRAPASDRAALEMLARAEGLFIIAASTRQQEAIEVPELGHGVLTYALLSGLGATGDAAVPPIVTMHHLLTYISQKVPELAARYGRSTRQVPVGFHRGMDFPLAVR